MPPGRTPKSPRKGNTPTKGSLKANPDPTPTSPPFIQESFEKQLRALVFKAKDETWLNRAGSQALILTQSITLLSLAGAYSTVSLLTLSPVYGSFPSAIYHSRLVISALFLGWSASLILARWLRPFDLTPKQVLPLIALYIPTIQFFLFQFSGKLGVSYGPLLTELVTFVPLLIVSISSTALLLDTLELPAPPSTSRLRYVTDSLPGLLSYAVFRITARLSSSYMSRAMGQTFLVTRLGSQILISVAYSLLAPSKLLLYALPAVLHTALFNTHVPLPYMDNRLNSTLHSLGWSLLERRESITGYLSVIEKENSFVALRCDHSILGGEWLEKAVGQRPSSGIREPIYGVFAMLEAVRLVEREQKLEDKDASALVIGYGIGTAPTALIHHGIDTTIVEIDPVVYEFATRYFKVASLAADKVIIQDALTYAAELVQQQVQHDYIIHDVFTGGVEPVDLFTFEFLQDLYHILKPGGVIAINYAGDISLPSFQTILVTIHAVFPRTSCRIFRESPPPADEKSSDDLRDFANMVIFCLKDLDPRSSDARSSQDLPQAQITPGPGSHKKQYLKAPGSKLIFREPNKGDYLGSQAREMFLAPKYELRSEQMREGEEGHHPRQNGDDGGMTNSDAEVLFRNRTSMLDEWAGMGARGHWEVMRGVVEGEVWNAW